MSYVTITRHYSGFNNVADKFSVGNNECAKNTSVTDYVLPEGYEIDADVVRDPAGYQCEIVPHSSGRPQLVSLAGKINTSPVLTKVEA